MDALYFRIIDGFSNSRRPAIDMVVGSSQGQQLGPDEPWEAKKGAAVRTDRLPHRKARRILVGLGIVQVP